VRFILREFPFDPRAAAAIMLARCAPENQFSRWSMCCSSSRMSGRVPMAARLLQIARLAGFTQESFEACLTNQKLLDDINAVRERGAAEFGVNVHPTFFINGKKYAGALTVDRCRPFSTTLL
jgi:protein-disulfide isomerase